MMQYRSVTPSETGIEWDALVERSFQVACEYEVQNAIARYQRMDDVFLAPLIEGVSLWQR